jgi:hypothetical protein
MMSAMFMSERACSECCSFKRILSLTKPCGERAWSGRRSDVGLRSGPKKSDIIAIFVSAAHSSGTMRRPDKLPRH